MWLIPKYVWAVWAGCAQLMCNISPSFSTLMQSVYPWTSWTLWFSLLELILSVTFVTQFFREFSLTILILSVSFSLFQSLDDWEFCFFQGVENSEQSTSSQLQILWGGHVGIRSHVNPAEHWHVPDSQMVQPEVRGNMSLWQHSRSM